MNSSKKISIQQIEEMNISDIKNLVAALAAKLESETDPTVPDHVKEITTEKIAGWDAKATQMTADQAGAKIHLKDATGNTISTLAVGFLNNEGTTIVFNTTTKEIELKNDAGAVLSSFPASDLVSNMPAGINMNGTSLELLDSSGNVVDNTPLSIANIQGLAIALAGKEPKFSKNAAFNKNFGTTSDTVAKGNDSRFHAHENKAILDAIDQAKVDEWDGGSAAGKYDKTGGKISGMVGIGKVPEYELDVEGFARIANMDRDQSIQPFVKWNANTQKLYQTNIIDTQRDLRATKDWPELFAELPENACGPWVLPGTILLPTAVENVQIDNASDNLQDADVLRFVCASEVALNFSEPVYSFQSRNKVQQLTGTTEIVLFEGEWYKIN